MVLLFIRVYLYKPPATKMDMNSKDLKINNKLYNNEWLQWFIGFSDAEGSFTIYLKKIDILNQES